MRLVVLPLAATAIGLILALTMGTLFGLILVLAGVMALVVFLGPAMERLGEMLSTGKFRRTIKK